MRFLHPELLWLLLLIPVIGYFFGRKGAAPALLFSSTSIASRLSSARKTRLGRLSLILRLASVTLLIVALARPQVGSSNLEIEASGIDILLAVDVSGSMEAMDFTLGGKPTNRLEVVKKVVAEFIEQRPNDRIGLLAFGGRPYLVSPLTLDHSWLRKRLESIRIGMVEDGTAIGSAIGSGTNRLRDRKSKSRILILLTDGMNNAGRIPPLVAAEAAETLGIKVYTIGAGTRGEAPIPVTDSFGRKKLIQARVDIDEKTLREVAEKTGATYFRATDTASLAEIYKAINSMETTTRTIKKFENYRELFSYLVLSIFVLLGVEVYQSRKRVP
ncbi:VWA domain-containing protein [Desulforhopalus sp. IMCC35007]|uniref:vWA domain-containing protein n=1 Tax=Desulforhopalus sp. IMCC35007 TaxID=2569543 RepID=UPI0010AE9A83|nr:VWA domain-containing protein [Desulforhopalus sp. IMCC35007]TKB11765.1 VWA domain-containing protein [Desulforhopalus sp. IMCC35007]